MLLWGGGKGNVRDILIRGLYVGKESSVERESDTS
jgi:hypothetical protein